MRHQASIDPAARFEFDIKRDIRNNAVVREIDRERQRELWTATIVGAFLVLVLLFYAAQPFEMLRYGYGIERMQAQRAAQEELNRQLRLEIDSLRSLDRIERIATGQLHLVAPEPEDVVTIERVRAPAPPGPSVVAAVR